MKDWTPNELSEIEAAKLRQDARDNYSPGTLIKIIWHPVYIAGCEAINRERQDSQDWAWTGS